MRPVDRTRYFLSYNSGWGRTLPQTDITNETSTNTSHEPAIEIDEPEIDAEPAWLTAVRAAESKKATDIKVLDLTEVTTFADYFVICSGSNSRQLQAITDEIALQMKRRGEPAMSIEGYDGGEWVLSDYSDIIVHVFSEKARSFYDLDRLWRQARPVEVPAQ